MPFPDFFAAAPRITLHDPLADFLGAAAGGALEYRYEDVVKLAGHSCPTVASAYLMVRRGLIALYPKTLPVRGGIRVELPEARSEGVTGVVAIVASFLTGAAEDGGFKGIGGHFARRDLLFFGAGIAGQLRLTRVDSGAGVNVSSRLDRVPSDPRVAQLVPKCVRGIASPEERSLFQSLWQSRVKALLLDHADDPDVIAIAD